MTVQVVDSAGHAAPVGVFNVFVPALRSITVTAPAAQTATADTAMSFNLGNFTQSNTTGPYTLDVNWGDGTLDTRTAVTGQTLPTINHVYQAARTFTVTVTIVDAAAVTSGTASFSVTVAAAPLVRVAFRGVPVLGGVAGEPFPIYIDAEDAAGNNTVFSQTTLTFGVKSGPAGAMFDGTSQIYGGIYSYISGGEIEFDGQVLSLPGTYTLYATINGITTVSQPFTLAPSKVVTVYSFNNYYADVQSGLVDDAAGNLFSVDDGNAGSPSASTSTIYKLSGNGDQTYTKLASFYGSIGAGPSGNLTLDAAGDLFGTDLLGGPYGDGVLYETTCRQFHRVDRLRLQW